MFYLSEEGLLKRKRFDIIKIVSFYDFKKFLLRCQVLFLMRLTAKSCYGPKTVPLCSRLIFYKTSLLNIWFFFHTCSDIYDFITWI